MITNNFDRRSQKFIKEPNFLLAGYGDALSPNGWKLAFILDYVAEFFSIKAFVTFTILSIVVESQIIFICQNIASKILIIIQNYDVDLKQVIGVSVLKHCWGKYQSSLI